MSEYTATVKTKSPDEPFDMAFACPNCGTELQVGYPPLRLAREMAEALRALLAVTLGGNAEDDIDPEGWAWNELTGQEQDRVTATRHEARTVLAKLEEKS